MQILQPGVLLQHGSYRIEKVLGQGGFGITYLALDINLGRLVAIKEFFPKDYCDRDATTSRVRLGTQSTAEFVNRLKAKFLKEARNIAKFDHPGIIRIYSAFEENNTAYYVMEYIEGESLSAMVKNGGPLPEKQALDYIEKVGEALIYVHDRRINHLDVKPANIMVRRKDGAAILIDFGLSKQYDSEGHQTSTTPTGISHGFAPMEQYNDGGVKEFSPQTDCYSLAATLYYILSGVTPPQAPRLVEEELTFPATIPAKLIGPISKAMSSGRKNRHETIADFLADLRMATRTYTRNEKTRTDSDATEVKPAAPKPTPKPRKPNNPDWIKKEPPKSKYKNFIAWGAGILIVALPIILWALLGNHSANEDSVQVEDSVIALVHYQDDEISTPLGNALYTGYTNPEDTLINDENAVLKIIDGPYKGNVYEGPIKNGILEGKATYTLANGDVFEGEFKDNQYHKGRYTSKEDSVYFEGYFKDGLPDQTRGQWHDI
ncbi:MAG: protein kinase [Bacteroides sp.]|nr:protein kinase [Bacteroides sp.]